MLNIIFCMEREVNMGFSDLSMIFSENRCTLFGFTLWPSGLYGCLAGSIILRTQKNEEGVPRPGVRGTPS
jgi:hypothetical protein